MSRQGPEDGRPRVFVSVGTDVHPFDRLVRWVGDLARAQPDLAHWTVQRGRSAPLPDLDTVDLLEHDAVEAALSTADLVICHGGPTTIAEVRRRGRRPLVVPRTVVHGEHVDDHQVLFSRRLAASGLVLLAEDEAAFLDLVRQALEDPRLLQGGADPSGGVDAAVDAFARQVAALMAGAPRRPPVRR